jgi:hypothetical protein
MTDDPDNLILLYLRRLDGKIDHLTEVVLDLGRRVTSLEEGVARLHFDFAGQSARLDRVEARLNRIERRLDIVPA